MSENSVDTRPRQAYMIVPVDGVMPLAPATADTADGAELGAATLTAETGVLHVAVDVRGMWGAMAAMGLVTFWGPDRTPRLRVRGRAAFALLSDAYTNEVEA